MNTSTKVLALVLSLLAVFSAGCGDDVGAKVSADLKQEMQSAVDNARDHGTDAQLADAVKKTVRKMTEDIEQAIDPDMIDPGMMEHVDPSSRADAPNVDWADFPYQRWAVVEHVVSFVGSNGVTASGTKSTHRRYLVNPVGEWYEIPSSARAWALTVKEGAIMEIPDTILSWVAVEKTAGYPYYSHSIDALDGEYRAFAVENVMGHDEGIYFFVRTAGSGTF